MTLQTILEALIDAREKVYNDHLRNDVLARDAELSAIIDMLKTHIQDKQSTARKITNLLEDKITQLRDENKALDDKYLNTEKSGYTKPKELSDIPVSDILTQLMHQNSIYNLEHIIQQIYQDYLR